MMTIWYRGSTSFVRGPSRWWKRETRKKPKKMSSSFHFAAVCGGTHVFGFHVVIWSRKRFRVVSKELKKKKRSREVEYTEWHSKLVPVSFGECVWNVDKGKKRVRLSDLIKVSVKTAGQVRVFFPPLSWSVRENEVRGDTDDRRTVHHLAFRVCALEAQEGTIRNVL